MSPDEAEFVDRMGLFFERLGASRTMGGVYGRLMICEPPQQLSGELASTLSVSKASFSTVARQLQEAGMVERLPSAARQHRYRITPGGFTHVLNVQLALMG
jgi:DNA-binding transcriptional regulator GbsR (MarR family)